MPTLPLYTPNPEVPDAAHNVTAPGGYEWWYFDAEDTATDTQIVGIFFEGFILHPGYLRRYFKFLKRPTTHIPPVPRDFPCAYFVIYRNGKILSQFMTQYPAADFEASRDQTNVRIGPNTLIRDEAGALHLSMQGTPWRVTWQGPRRETGVTLRAEFTFKPRLPLDPHERRFFSPQLAGAEHNWVIADPLCDVTGTIEFGEKVSFVGRGYHDHNYGTGPIGPGLKRWVWGRMLLNHRVVTFHYALPTAHDLSPEVHLIEADATSRREISSQKVDCDWLGKTAMGLAYPKRIDFGEALRLSNPRVTDSAPFYMRLIYEATSRGEKGTAFCEVAHPHRLRWPILGRMIEMSIEQAKR
jgi:carotenoid 1,2-hydratase